MSENKKISVKFCANDCYIPSFVQEISLNKEYLKWGTDNLFPQYLLELFYNSSLHNSLITAKTDYIYGNGLYSDSENFQLQAFIKKCNNKGESLNWILKKCAFDLELFGGFALQIIYTKLGGKISEIYYADISKLRINPETNELLYSNDWKKYKVKAIRYPEFDSSKPEKSQIFYYKDFTSRDAYPIPNYVASIADITTDAEISKFRLATIQNGIFPGLLIDFKGGEPTEEEKGAIERMIAEKWGGSGKTGKFIVNFSDNGTESPTVTPIQQPDLDKMFVAIEESNREKIFTGHRITNPALFGVQTPGKLGTSNELQEAYTLFVNTYVSTEQEKLLSVFNNILNINFPESDLKIIPTDPVNNMFTNEDLISRGMSLGEVRTKLKETGWITEVENETYTLDKLNQPFTTGQVTSPQPQQGFGIDLELNEGDQIKLQQDIGKLKQGDIVTVIKKIENNGEVEITLKNKVGVEDTFYFDSKENI